MTPNPASMFTLGAFVVYLQRCPTIDDHTGPERPRTFDVHLTDDVTVQIDRWSLQCDDCDAWLDPPMRGWDRWLAWNKLLNGGTTRCPDCFESCPS